MNKRTQTRFKKTLDAMREDLIASARKAMTGDIHLDPDDFPDEIDSASSESGLAFIGRLRERERILVQKVDLALSKIEASVYGTCTSCGEDIGLKRLEARPVAELCIDCKSQEEKLEGRT